MVGEFIIPWGSTVHWYRSWDPKRLGKWREKVNLSLVLKGVKWSEVAQCVQLFEIPWTVAYQDPQSMGFPVKNTGVGCHFGCKGILKNQSCKSIIIMCQFWGIVVGDGVPGCNAPIGFIDALTFLRYVKKHHLLDFFFIIKIGEFQEEQDLSICFNSNCVSINSLAACIFFFHKGPLLCPNSFVFLPSYFNNCIIC